MSTHPEKPRRRRANGEESRQRILEAATEIASERGYEGTSIGRVSERSGLPASSIYWHFADKDALVAAVIEHSFRRWLAGVDGWVPGLEDEPLEERVRVGLEQTIKSLAENGDFLRLGLLLALERRPEEPSARRMFLQVRAESLRRMRESFGRVFADLDEGTVGQLAAFAMAMADGLFVAHELDGDGLDLIAQLDLLTAAVMGAARHALEQASSTRSNHSNKKANS